MAKRKITETTEAIDPAQLEQKRNKTNSEKGVVRLVEATFDELWVQESLKVAKGMRMFDRSK